MSKSIQDRLKRLETLYRCLCLTSSGGTPGPQGPQGIQGPPGSAAEACPDHFKLAAVSGKFSSNSRNSPTMKNMFSGNEGLGWSYGSYDFTPVIDGFGNLISIKYPTTFCGIPLPVDLNQGDTVRITGIAYIILGPTDPVNPTFYVTVSHFHCPEVSQKSPITPLYTIIPVTPYSIDIKTGKVCFSESVNLSTILPSRETFFVVGLGIGSTNDPAIIVDVKFSYSLDVTQACLGTGENLFIRSCCDPAYSEVILDNGTPVGGSFVDDDGNCWTVEATTLSGVTSIRNLSNSYEDCISCIASNPCPENFLIQSCCGEEDQVFSAALIGVNVGDTFVDTNGACWSAIDVTGAPITNVVDVDIVYSETSCEDETCITANPCPTTVTLLSCCGTIGGFSTLELLQAAVPSLVLGSVFVDTFGMCWSIKDSKYTFPTLSFIVPVTEYFDDGANIACDVCRTANECPEDFYYTVQNCCTEEIEVVILEAVYQVGETLLLVSTTGLGCYEVLSWSDTGIATLTLTGIEGVFKDCRECSGAFSAKYGAYCPGSVMCCTTYENISEKVPNPGTITGYKCDGTWVSDFVLNVGDSICMAQVLDKSEFIVKAPDCCGFDILNPSLTEDMIVTYETCRGALGQTVIPPNTLLSTVLEGSCVNCVRRLGGGDNDFVYVPCVDK